MTGSEIKRFRKRKNLTQKHLANLLGVTEQFISNIENERATVPSFYLPILSRTLGVHVKDLIELLVQDYRQKLIDSINCKP